MTLICIPLIDETIEGMFKTGGRCKTMGADLLEVRLDFLKESIKDSTLNELSKLEERISLPVIVTLRPKWEGGNYEGTEETRLAIIEKCISMGYDYVDLELNINNEKLAELITKARDNQVKTIVSYHDFQNTPEQDEIVKTLKRCLASDCNIAKLVYTCNTYQDALNILKAGKAASEQKLSFSIMGMGDFGQMTRILGPAIGCEIVYASIDKDQEVVAGQVEIQTITELWKILGYN